MARRLEGSRLVWLLLGSLVPLLFLLDWVVDREEPRTRVVLDTELEVRADGQDPWVFATSLYGRMDENGLRAGDRGTLRTAIYPWLETQYVAELMLFVSREVLAAGNGTFDEGFTARIRQFDARRADGLGTPPVPCTGRLLVSESELVGDEVAVARFEVDLICTSAGRDLKWRSGDEQVWTLKGPITLTHLKAHEDPGLEVPAPGP